MFLDPKHYETDEDEQPGFQPPPSILEAPSPPPRQDRSLGNLFIELCLGLIVLLALWKNPWLRVLAVLSFAATMFVVYVIWLIKRPVDAEADRQLAYQEQSSGVLGGLMYGTFRVVTAILAFPFRRRTWGDYDN